MAITKKQKDIIETRYKTMHQIIAKELYPEDLKEVNQATINELTEIMKILNYTRNDFITLKNEVMQQYDLQLYCLYNDLNRTMNEITGTEVIFEYEYTPKVVYSHIEQYDYDVRRYGTLKNQMHEIKKYIENGKAIRSQIEKQIAQMIA